MQFISKRKLQNMNYKFQRLEMWQKGLIALAGFIVVSSVVSFCFNNAISAVTGNTDPNNQTTAVTEKQEQNTQGDTNTTPTDQTTHSTSDKESDTDTKNQGTNKTPRMGSNDMTMSQIFEQTPNTVVKLAGDGADYKTKNIHANTLFEVDGIRCYTTDSINIVPVNMAAALKELIGTQTDSYPQPVITDSLEVELNNTYQYLINVIDKDDNAKVYIVAYPIKDKGYKVIEADPDLVTKFTDGEAVDYYAQN